MKIYILHTGIISLLVFSQTLAIAAWDTCRAEVNRLAKTKREQLILTKTEPLLEAFGLTDCNQEIDVALVVAIHEGVHFLDLGILRYGDPLPTQMDEFHREWVSFFLPDLQSVNVPDLNLPSPNEILKMYFQRHDTISVGATSSLFRSFYAAYIADTDMFSSSDLMVGFSTELNAYTHGLLTAVNIEQALNKEIQSVAVQRVGVLFFLTLFDVYLQQLKLENLKKWQELLKDSKTVNLVNILVENAVESLETSAMCAQPAPSDSGPIKDFESLGAGQGLKHVLSEALADRLSSTVSCSRN